MEAVGQPLEVAGPRRRSQHQPVGERRRQRPAGIGRPAASSATPAPRARAAAPRRRCRRPACPAAGRRSARAAADPARRRAAPRSPARQAPARAAARRRRAGPPRRRARLTALGRQRDRLDADDAQAALSPTRRSPSSTGDTFQPARRSASQSSSGDPPAVARLDRGEPARRRRPRPPGRSWRAPRRSAPARRPRAPSPRRGPTSSVASSTGCRRQWPRSAREHRPHASRPPAAAAAPRAPSRAASRALWVDHQQRRAGLGDEPEHQVEHRVAGRLVEAAGRLVGEDQPRPRPPAPGRSPPAAAGRRTAARDSGRAARRARAASPARRAGRGRAGRRAAPGSRGCRATSRLGIRLNCWNTSPTASRRSAARPASPSGPTAVPGRPRTRRDRRRRARRRGAAACSCRCPIRRSAPGWRPAARSSDTPSSTGTGPCAVG